MAPDYINSVEGVLYIILPVPPYITGIMYMTGRSMAIFIVMISIVLFTSIVLVLLKDGHPYLRSSVVGIWRAKVTRFMQNNGLIAVFYLYVALLTFSVIYNLFITITIKTPHTPNFGSLPLWKLISILMIASVWEEITTRVVYIGLPLLIFAYFGIHPKDGTKTSYWRYVIGGGIKITLPRLVLILVSSLMFSLAHLRFWDIFKLLPTFIVGLALSYLYLKYGIQYAILLHFAFDVSHNTANMILHITKSKIIYNATLVFTTTYLFFALAVGILIGGYLLYRLIFYFTLLKSNFGNIKYIRESLHRYLKSMLYLHVLIIVVTIMFLELFEMNTKWATNIYKVALVLSLILSICTIIIDSYVTKIIRNTKPKETNINIKSKMALAFYLIILSGLLSLPFGYLAIAQGYSRYKVLFY